MFVAVAKSSSEAARLIMSYTASQFQPVLNIIKEWRQEAFEALKVEGQYALCDLEPAVDYFTCYYSVQEWQVRGFLHVHTLHFFDEPSLDRATLRRLGIRLGVLYTLPSLGAEEVD